MRIVISNSDGSSPITLGDDSARMYIRGYLPKPKWDVKISKRGRAPRVTIWPRYNAQWDISFRVVTSWPDYDTAAAWYHDHPDSVPYQGILMVEDHGTIRTFPDATKTSITPVGELTGVSVEFDYQFVASQNLDNFALQFQTNS